MPAKISVRLVFQHEFEIGNFGFQLWFEVTR